MEEYFIASDGRKRKGIWKECELCKEQFISRADWNTKLCNKECSDNYSRRKRIIVSCHICDNEIERTERRLKTSKSGLHFCSRKCKEYAQSLEGGVTEIQPGHYGDGSGGSSTYRKRALLEYGEKCKLCGYDKHMEGLQVHHIDHNRGNNDITNLIVLCGTDHLLVHRGIVKLGVPDGLDF